MIHPGLVVLAVAIVVLLQIGVVVWVRRDIRGLEASMNGRMDEFVKALNEQITRETALTMLAQETLAEARKALDRIDVASMQ